MVNQDISSDPTTSKFYDYSLENALEIFDKMVIGGGDRDGKVEKNHKQTAAKPVHSLEPYYCQRTRGRSKLRFRWKPYNVPRCSVRERVPPSDSLYIMLRKIKWRDDVDVEALKYTLFERKDVPCGVQAARPPSPEVEVEELAEYFSHFVRVDLKMSALAESMYC